MVPDILTPDGDVMSDHDRLRDDAELSAAAGAAKARLEQSENARADSNHDPNAIDPFAPPETPKLQVPKGQMSNAPSAPLRWYNPAPTVSAGENALAKSSCDSRAESLGEAR